MNLKWPALVALVGLLALGCRGEDSAKGVDEPEDEPDDSEEIEEIEEVCPDLRGAYAGCTATFSGSSGTGTYSFDLMGNRTLVQLDSDNDGTTDETTEFAYDGDGRVLEQVFSGSGVSDSVVRYEYRDDGQISAIEFPTSLSSYFYDADDRLERVERDFGPDGTIDESCGVTWSEASGVATERRECPSTTSEYDYDALRREIATRTFSPDGIWTRSTTTSYDDVCNPLQKDTVYNQGTSSYPLYDRVNSTYGYDVDHRLLGYVTEYLDLDGELDDFVVDEVVTYSCP